MRNEKVLIVEDNDSMRLGLTESLKRDGYIVSSYSNGPDALSDFKINLHDAAILDLKMEPLDGIQILEEIKKINPKTEVLMISAYGSVETAVKAMQHGALDFITKPFSQEEFRIRIGKVFEKIEQAKKVELLLEQNRILNDEIYSDYAEMIGDSDSIRQIFALIEKVAATESSVLITGESGTGKELVARAIHKKSRRAENAFIRVNCGALNENLLESELFGHEKGAFTGAIKSRKGRFELANSGTLFLDEIGDVSPAMQIKLLRVIQEGEFEKVGGEETLKTDARIICATNRDLPKLIAENKFREDLFYRLSVIPIHLPPLRERKEDIPQLIMNALKKTAVKNNLPLKLMSDQALQLLLNYSWPGNIRELENLIERLSVITPAMEIDAVTVASHINKPMLAVNAGSNLLLEEAVYHFEKNLIIEAMKKGEGVKARAAKLLGISTSVLYYKLEKFGLL